jgi:hypothetical protein
MMKEICSQCLQRHRDPVIGTETVVFSCFNQDQEMDQVDFPTLHRRLTQNGAQEKLTKLWGRPLPPPPRRAPGWQRSKLPSARRLNKHAPQKTIFRGNMHMVAWICPVFGRKWDQIRLGPGGKAIKHLLTLRG